MCDTEVSIICCIDKCRWHKTGRIGFAFIDVIFKNGGQKSRVPIQKLKVLFNAPHVPTMIALSITAKKEPCKFFSKVGQRSRSRSCDQNV